MYNKPCGICVFVSVLCLNKCLVLLKVALLLLLLVCVVYGFNWCAKCSAKGVPTNLCGKADNQMLTLLEHLTETSAANMACLNRFVTHDA